MKKRYADIAASLAAACALAVIATPATAAGRSDGDIALRRVARDGISAVATASCPTYDSGSLFDGRLWSAWAAPAGEAAELQLDLGRTRYLVRLDVVVGDARNPKSFRASQRPRRLVVVAADERRSVTLEDTSDVQTIHFDPPLEARVLALVAEDPTGPSGAKCGAALSELTLWEPSDVLSLRPALRAEIDARLADLLADGTSGDARRKAREALIRIGAPGATSVLLALRSAPGERAEDLARVLAGIGDTRGAAIVNERLFRAVDGDRLALLRALAHLPDARHVDMLSRTGQSGDRRERIAAALALAVIPGRPAEAALVALVQADDPDVASAAAAGFCGRDGAALLRLLPTLRSADTAVQAAALSCLPEELSAADRDRVRALLPALSAPQCRAAVLARTCRPGDAAALQAAVELTRHPDANVRAAVVRCLDRGAAPDEQLVGLATDPSPAVRDAALGALSRRGPAALGALPVRVLDAAPADIGPFVNVMRAATFEERFQTALLWTRYGLPTWTRDAARLLEPASPEALRAALDEVSADSPHAGSLLRLLTARRTQWADVAGRLVAAGEWRERPLLVPVLGAVGRPQDVPLLDPVLAVHDPRLLGDAASALAALGGPDAAQRLVALVGPDRPERARVAAVQALGERGDDVALEPLAALVDDETAPPAVRAAAIEAIGRVHGPRALPAIERAFLAEDYAVRRAALVACQRMDDGRALALLGRAAADGDPAIRELGLTLLSQR